MTDLRKAAEDALKLLEHWAVTIEGEWGTARTLEELEKEGSLEEEILNLRAALEQEKKWNLIAEMHNVEQDSLVPKDFNDWWDADQLTQTNPFREDSPAYWAFEGWCARDVETKRLGKLCDDFIGQMMVLRAEKQLREAISKLKDKP